MLLPLRALVRAPLQTLSWRFLVHQWAAAQRTTWPPAMSTVSATLPMFAGGRALRLCLLDVRLSCVCCVLCPVHLMAP